MSSKLTAEVPVVPASKPVSYTHLNRNLFGIHFYGLNPQSTGKGWVLWFFASNYANTENEELIQLVFDHVGPCIKCSAACEVQGVDMNFFGRAYTNICYQFPVRFNNPDSETLQKVKLLIDFCQKDVYKRQRQC